MKCCALWYGGANYTPPDPQYHLEHFDSLREAVRAFTVRADSHPRYPCVDEEETEMHVYFGTEYHENGPDRIIRFGKRGGVRIERA